MLHPACGSAPTTNRCLPRRHSGTPSAEEDVWLFGYGSLMWNPAMHFAEHRAGRVLGWHRKYCLWLEAGRGSPEAPGLMLGLDRGGAASGALFRVPARQARAELLLPFRRELFTHSYDARWVSVATAAGPVRAVTFVVNREGLRYVRRLGPGADRPPRRHRIRRPRLLHGISPPHPRIPPRNGP